MGVPTMPTPLLSAPTRVFATERLASASASRTTRVLLARELCAPMAAVMPEFVSPRSSWQLRPAAVTLSPGMPRSTSDVFAILVAEDLTALLWNALLEPMFLRDTVTRLDVTALVVVFAITLMVPALASTDTTAPSASTRPSWVKCIHNFYSWFGVFVTVSYSTHM